jgi:hypothetical protein
MTLTLFAIVIMCIYTGGENKYLKKGDVVYEDVDLLIPLAGYDYICDVVTGRIFEMDSVQQGKQATG